jgi:hypothetical protein
MENDPTDQRSPLPILSQSEKILKNKRKTHLIIDISTINVREGFVFIVVYQASIGARRQASGKTFPLLELPLLLLLAKPPTALRLRHIVQDSGQKIVPSLIHPILTLLPPLLLLV